MSFSCLFVCISDACLTSKSISETASWIFWRAIHHYLFPPLVTPIDRAAHYNQLRLESELPERDGDHKWNVHQAHVSHIEWGVAGGQSDPLLSSASHRADRSRSFYHTSACGGFEAVETAPRNRRNYCKS